MGLIKRSVQVDNYRGRVYIIVMGKVYWYRYCGPFFGGNFTVIKMITHRTVVYVATRITGCIQA